MTEGSTEETATTQTAATTEAATTAAATGNADAGSNNAATLTAATETAKAADKTVAKAADATKTSKLEAGAAAVEPPPDWAPDWREKMAAGDDKELKRLQRFQSPLDVYKQNRELEKLRDSGKLKAVLPDNPTAEDLATYRKDHGIPEAPTGYDLNIEGVDIADTDKPRLSIMTTALHGVNATPTQVKAIVAAYYGMAAQEQQARETAEVQARDTSRAELRKEWGGEYDGNFNAIGGVMDEFPGLKDMFGSAIMKDGTPLGYNSAAMRDLAKLCRELRPYATITTQGGGDKAAAVEGELTKLNALMADDQSPYWKGPEAAANQARWRELNTAVEQMKSRTRAV